MTLLLSILLIFSMYLGVNDEELGLGGAITNTCRNISLKNWRLKLSW